MIHPLILVLALAGFAALLLAMTRHQQDWLGRKLPERHARLLRGAGFALLALAYPCAGSALGWAYGALCWLGWLTLGAAATMALNINRKPLLRRIRR